MNWKNLDKKHILKITQQFAGKFEDIDGDLVPIVLIEGCGDIWCYHITKNKHIRLYRGTRAMVMSEEEDEYGRVLIFTERGDLVAIDPNDLIKIGFN
tara:strand:- start:613 stop:903 length:291 start_codon:yes stop_codon:yes gene_type:complete